METTRDFVLQDHGESFELLPLTGRAHAWVDEQHAHGTSFSASLYEQVTTALREQGMTYARRMH